MLRARYASAIVVILAASALAEERKANDFFRARTDVVLINAAVLDRNHRPVRGLARDRFRLFENKVEQHISYFAEEETPLSLVVVFDASGSMDSKIVGARRALSAMLADPGNNDEFSLITFADRAELALPWNPVAADLQSRVAFIRPRGLTSLLDAIHLALTQLHSAKNARRAILILSDGGDNHSRHNERQIARILEEADVQMYAVDMSPAANLRQRSPEEVGGPGMLARLCSRAGGRYWQVDGGRELAKAADQIAKEMRSQYVLGYAPSSAADDGLFHHVRLQLLPASGDPKLSVYWRHGYRAPGQ